MNATLSEKHVNFTKEQFHKCLHILAKLKTKKLSTHFCVESAPCTHKKFIKFRDIQNTFELKKQKQYMAMGV